MSLTDDVDYGRQAERHVRQDGRQADCRRQASGQRAGRQNGWLEKGRRDQKLMTAMAVRMCNQSSNDGASPRPACATQTATVYIGNVIVSTTIIGRLNTSVMRNPE